MLKNIAIIIQSNIKQIVYCFLFEKPKIEYDKISLL